MWARALGLPAQLPASGDVGGTLCISAEVTQFSPGLGRWGWGCRLKAGTGGSLRSDGWWPCRGAELPRACAEGSVVVVLEPVFGVPLGKGHTIMLGLLAKGQECGGPGCGPTVHVLKPTPWVPPVGALIWGAACVPGPALQGEGQRRVGAERSWQLGATTPTGQSTSRLPPALHLGILRPGEQEHFACSHGTEVGHRTWSLPRPALVCSRVPPEGCHGGGAAPSKGDPAFRLVSTTPLHSLPRPCGCGLPGLGRQLGVGWEPGLGSPVVWVGVRCEKACGGSSGDIDSR